MFTQGAYINCLRPQFRTRPMTSMSNFFYSVPRIGIPQFRIIPSLSVRVCWWSTMLITRCDSRPFPRDPVLRPSGRWRAVTPEFLCRLLIRRQRRSTVSCLLEVLRVDWWIFPIDTIFHLSTLCSVFCLFWYSDSVSPTTCRSPRGHPVWVGLSDVSYTRWGGGLRSGVCILVASNDGKVVEAGEWGGFVSVEWLDPGRTCGSSQSMRDSGT